MKRMNRRKVWAGLTVLWLGFIFWNALHTGTASDHMCSAVLAWLHELPGTARISSCMAWEVARFTEFWILGALFSLWSHALMYTVQKRFTLSLLGVLQTAVIYETVPYFVPGRTGMVRNVLIDFSSGACAVLIVAVLLWLLWGRKQIRQASCQDVGVSWKKTPHRWLFFVILAVLLCFIWGNSILNACVSNEISETSLKIVRFLETAAERNKFVKAAIEHMGIAVDNHRIRKLAHFSEYSLLGMALLFLVGGNRRKPWEYWHLLWLLAVWIPVMDEGIQYFSKGRTPLITDVWIDFCGIVCGIFLASVFERLRRRLWH